MIVWHLEAIECLDGHDTEPCAAVDEGLGDLDVADDGRAKHRESAGSRRALELVRRAEGDGAFGPPERARGLGPWEGRVHLASKLLEDALGCWGLSSVPDASARGSWKPLAPSS